MIYYQFNLWKIFQQNVYFDRIIIPIFSIHLGHYTSENVYQKKFVQSQWLLYFYKYGYGEHVDIKCKSFNMSLIRFQMKCHIFCSKLLSKIFLVNIFAGTVSWADWLFFFKVSRVFFFKCKNGFKKFMISCLLKSILTSLNYPTFLKKVIKLV